MMDKPRDPADLRYAAAVVVGRISGVERIIDPKPRESILKEKTTDPSSYWNKAPMPTRFMGDYVRFRFTVDEVLVGATPRSITVAWGDFVYPLPKNLESESHLIAVVRRETPGAHGLNPIATITDTMKNEEWFVLQQPCSRAFMEPADSKDAIWLRNALSEMRR